MLTLHTLGSLRLDGPEGELLRGRRKELALLVYLARRRPRAVPREKLADLLWGSRPDANARQSLRQALLSLKRAVPTGFDADADAVTLAADALELDVDLFEADLAAARRAEAVARWQGDFLTGCDDVGDEAYRIWVEGEREGLRKRLQVALAELVDDAERRGDPSGAVAWAERWADTFPLDERAAIRLIRAFHRAGRGGDAHARHAAFAARLGQDLGVAPSAEFERLGDEIAPDNLPAYPTPASGALFTPDLVGRTAAIEALTRAWGLATAGTTALVLVEGDEGMGKTRLCEEFERTLPVGTVVLRARGIETARSVPYTTARELLAGLETAPGLSGARGTALAAVGTLAPGVRERFPTAVAPGPDSELAEAVADVLAAVAAETPVLLFVDDYPMADRESRALLLAVARRLRHAAVCILVASRSADTPPDLLAELRGRVGETRVRLTPLSEQDVDALLASMLEVAPDTRPALAHRLYTESGGNPFYLIETTATLLDEGRVTADARGVWRPSAGVIDGTLPVPPSIRAAARRRYEALSADGRAVAEAAAVLGAQTTHARLALVTHLPEEVVETAIEELVLRRVLRPSSARSGVYDFAHDVTRRAALDGLQGTRRRRLHAAALRALRSAPPAPDVTAAIAHHRRHAGPLGGRLPPWVGTRTLVVGGALVAIALAWLRPGTSTAGFAERDWIVLADLDNVTGDSVFDESLTAALFVSISQSQHVNVFPPSRVRETLRRMQQDTVRRFTERLAREVAQREGIRAVVTLTLTRTDDRYALTSRIVDPATGRTLATLTTAAQGRDHVLGALDALAADLRRDLGESAREIHERNVPLPQATTSSLEALKLFADGSRALDEDRTQDGLAALRSAIALDSNFAWAHAMLGRYLVWLNNPGEAAPHLERAVAVTDRLPERERLWIRRLVAEGQQDRPEAVRLARVYLAQYPDDRDAWFALGRTLQEAQDREGALEAYRRVVELDPNARFALTNTALLHDLLGRPREAVAAFERAAATDSTVVMQVAGDLNRIYGFALLRTGDSARARSVFDRLLSGSPGQRINGLRSLALLDAYYGRYDRAAAGLTQSAQLSKAEKATVSEFRNRLYLAGMYRTRGQLEAARNQLRIADDLQRGIRMPLPWLGFLGRLQVRVGLVEDAARTLEAMEERGTPSTTNNDRAAIALVRAEVALAQQRPEDAVAAFASAVELNGVSYERQGLAAAQLAAGQPQAAVATLTVLLADSAIGWEVQEPWVMAHYDLAQLYDALGDSAAALPLYRRLAEQWRSGDPDLPILQSIRRRLGRGG
ncbi:MAG: AAA family ATPase [Gemmatimonadota bacterium]|nr:AAA family ATPase [Gemmatimonadota bacterium]